MAYQGFVFSEDTSDLDEAEFALALAQLDAVDAALTARQRLTEADPGAAAIIAPDEGWHPDSQPSFELDGSTKNAQTSHGLLARRDRQIIRKLRFYAQAFTGYQLATLELAAGRPWIAEPLPADWDAVLARLAGRPDEAVMQYVAMAGALPAELNAAPPRKFGEIGWLMDDVIVNRDTYGYLERLCLMHENGLIDLLRERLAERGSLRIIEIGAGYGGLAYQLMGLFENLRYAIIDIPESLAFSGIYLGVLCKHLDNQFANAPGKIVLPSTAGFTFVPNFRHSDIQIPEGGVDLIINTLSLSEMSDAQIEDYCAAGQRLMGKRGLFFEQNHQRANQGPGGFFPSYFKNLRQCGAGLIPAGYPERLGSANIWVNADYSG